MLKHNNKNLENIIKIKNIEIEKLDKEMKESEEELENSYKNVNEKKKEYNGLKILNDELNEEIQELNKELQQYSNELDKLYSLDNTKSQKTIEELKQKIDILEKEKKELEQKIHNVELIKNSINNELAHAVHIMKKKYPEKLKIFEESRKSEFKKETEEPEEPEKYDINTFDKYGKHKHTNTKYDFSGFDKYGFDKCGFGRHDLHKDTKNKYDPNGFDKYGKHKDTNTFLDKEKNMRKDILRNIKWLEDRDKFLELYDKIIKNGEIIVNIENNPISSDIPKDFLEDILSGNIKYKDLEHYAEDINDIEQKLNNSIKNKKSDKLKNYIKKINYLVYGKDKEKIKTDQAKSFEDQKVKGYVNLPIALSKIYTNNSSNELTSNIKQLINDLYNTKQITKQVYNKLIKSITYQ